MHFSLLVGLFPYRTLIGRPIPEVEAAGQRGRSKRTRAYRFAVIGATPCLCWPVVLRYFMRLRSSRVVWASSAVSVGVLVVAAGWLGACVWAPRCVHGVSRDRSPGGGVADGCAAPPFCGLSFVRATSELQFLRRPVDSQPAVCAPGPWSGLVTASEHAAVWSVYTWVQWPIQKIMLGGCEGLWGPCPQRECRGRVRSPPPEAGVLMHFV